MKVFADKGKLQEKLLHAFHIQAVGVMGVVVFYTGDFLTAFHKEFVIVQVSGITGDTVVITHIDGLGHLFTGHQRFIQLLSVAGTDDFDFSSTMVQLFQRISQNIQCSGRSLLDKRSPLWPC